MEGLVFIAKHIMRIQNVSFCHFSVCLHTITINQSDVPLLQRSLELWFELHDFYENEMSIQNQIAPYGTNVMTLCGGIMIGELTTIHFSDTY